MRYRVIIIILIMLALAAGGAPSGAQTPPAPLITVVAEMAPQVISVRPHDTSAYTQGLLLHDGHLYESTGRYGESSLRRVDPLTGEVVQRFNLDPAYFAEGLALVDDRLIQITWKEQTAFFYDRETFASLGAFSYTGEGWGLCYDGQSLWMTDGSATLFRRDPDTFTLLGQVTVTLYGVPISRLNELECVGSSVYANVYQTDLIVRIFKETGQVTERINAAGLLTPEEQFGADVLNGIAYSPETDTFFITGKWWPKLFEVRFVAQADRQPTGQ